jgi:hypothetical protein
MSRLPALTRYGMPTAQEPPLCDCGAPGGSWEPVYFLPALCPFHRTRNFLMPGVVVLCEGGGTPEAPSAPTGQDAGGEEPRKGDPGRRGTEAERADLRVAPHPALDAAEAEAGSEVALGRCPVTLLALVTVAAAVAAVFPDPHPLPRGRYARRAK